ncbi:NPCBM/NEW2 domain-containing protein [Asticcacaulis benevestitus]|uniref:Alpha-galactosidase n=1 Tax=Asticcacaulis benevestitus DSM 16100 = ATCC BAA-896 TaxID=1121022 RepID=V4PWA7_9CAUL|nr:NPCBM/NEW2 domain-containing protein [Asticcacaulis benevestitus]ESQ92636.1 alpha-galactosidase [Asticcacaulis benevestitus DSM 16100 = ATCC BAA-896]
MLKATLLAFTLLTAPTLPQTAMAQATAAQASIDPLAPAGRWTGATAGRSPTPPMGWNSWNAFHTEIDEAKVMGTAKVLVDSGLRDLGYTYVNIDDGWWLKRRTSDNRMQVRTQIFPSAKIKGSETSSFRPFTDTLHSMGLKAGIYSDIGGNACSQAYDLHSPNLPEGTTAERQVGLLGHVQQDIKLYFGDWGFDYIKVDACGLNVYAPDSAVVKQYKYNGFPPLIDQTSINRTNIPAVRALYQEVADALASSNPDGDYIFSICAWGSADVRSWGKEVGNLWRTSGDITPQWTRMLHTFDSASTRALYAGPGHWNDPDMLFVGHGDFDEKHLTEAHTHFSLWAMINAPLMIGYDLRNAPPELMNIWANKDIIRLNQDSGGHQAVLAYDSDDVQIFVKTLSDSGTKGVLLFNRGLAPADVTLTPEQMKMIGDVALTDLWSKAALTLKGELKITLQPRESRVFEARGKRQLPDGFYLSEIPGALNVARDGIVAPEPDPIVHRMSNPWGATINGGERPTYTGWGGAQADATPYDQALKINGQAFLSGIGILANSRLEVRATGYTRFEAKVGIDDSTRNLKDKVVFQVFGDGRLLTEATAAYGQEAQPLKADLVDVKIVELVVRNTAQSSDLPLVVTWADAALKK